MTIAVVLVGGDIPERTALAGVADADLVIAVDGGVRIARNHGLPVHVLLGDLDSVSEGNRVWAEAEGAEVIAFPEDKDATDLELALDHALAAGAERIVALGVEGGRLDHELGNWLVLCRPHAAMTEIRTSTGHALVLHGDHRNSIDLHGTPGDLVSLLPTSGKAVGVTTSGLRWPLEDATIEVGSTWGVSNEMLEDVASVSLTGGALLVVRPNAACLD